MERGAERWRRGGEREGETLARLHGRGGLIVAVDHPPTRRHKLPPCQGRASLTHEAAGASVALYEPVQCGHL